MLTAIAVTIIVAGALGYSMRTSRQGQPISRTPYNNRYSDAPAAREDHLG